MPEETKNHIVKKAMEKPEMQARSLLKEFNSLIKIPLNKLITEGTVKTNQIIKHAL